MATTKRTPFIPPVAQAVTAYKALITWRRIDRDANPDTDFYAENLARLRDVADRLEREAGDVQPAPVLDERIHQMLAGGAA